MTRICITDLGEALRAFEAMDFSERSALVDVLHQRQPNLLASIVVLRSLGASDSQVEVALHVLMITWLAMQSSGSEWPVITEELQESCLAELVRHMESTAGSGDESALTVIGRFIDSHREPNLLAYVVKHLQDCGVIGLRTEAERFVVLAALNVAQCVAYGAGDDRR